MATWLQVTSDVSGLSLIDTGRMRTIMQEMVDPAKQFPLSAFFVGKASKTRALRCLFPYNNIGRRAPPGIARLHVSISSAAAQFPTYIIDSSLESIKNASHTVDRFYRSSVHKYPIRCDKVHSCDDLRSQLYSRLLFPFSHTLYIFANDLGGIFTIQDLLCRWASLTARTENPYNSRPRLVVVIDDPEDSTHVSDIISRDIWNKIRLFVSAAKVIDLRDRHELSSAALYEPLRRNLHLELDLARQASEKQHMLFSATHLEALFHRAALHISQNLNAPFDALESARGENVVPQDAAIEHLHDFLTLAGKAKCSTSATASFIGSALLMDAYPPRMHKFHPGLVFQRLYAAPCAAAWTAASPNNANQGCDAVEREFVSSFNRLSRLQRTSTLRRKGLAARPCWGPLKTNLTCLSCLLRGTNHILPCGHSICNICVCIFGKRARQGEYRFNITSCIICQEEFTYSVRILPPTKGPTLLALDGGGIRGVISLCFLEALEKRLGHRGLKDDFDLTVGTSAGALIALELMIRGTQVEEATDKFKSMARCIFPRRKRRNMPFGKVWDFCCTWLTDGYYDSNVLDTTLERAFGERQYLFDVATSLPSGSLVALTASRVEENGSLCLFSNYRCSERPGQEASYTSIAPREMNEEPLVWQVARCNVAALGYFQTKHLRGIGTFQDGGVRANCPVKAALRESTLIWPSVRRPDLVLSIGTGYQQMQPGNDGKFSDCKTGNGWVWRAIQSFLYSPAVDGRQGWLDTYDAMPDNLKGDTFRLDQPLLGNIPELDNVDHMERLSDLQYVIPDELLRALLGVSFFFELDLEPSVSDGVVYCQGSILHYGSDAIQMLSVVQKEFPAGQFIMLGRSILGRVDENDGCCNCGYYRKRIAFTVSSIYEEIEIGIDSLAGFRKIGGFPTSIQFLWKRQEANAPFGRPDHCPDRWPPTRNCFCTVRSKRKAEPNLPAPPPKRRRRISE